jgi:alkyl hydroperoxide reductase subunit AhpC
LASHRAFADEAGGIDFPLLSDFWPHGRVAREYGIFDEERGHPRRSVFVVDRQGVIRWAYHAELGEQRDISKIIEVLDGMQARP